MAKEINIECPNCSTQITDKMSLLYSFTMQGKAIVEGFTQMQSNLDSEKGSMQKIWKQIEIVLENTIEMYSSLKGIAGNVRALELFYCEIDETV